MMYMVELNITDIPTQLVDAMKGIGANNEFETFHHGSDRLVFDSKSGRNFTNLINELSRVCAVYGVEYIDLLV